MYQYRRLLVILLLMIGNGTARAQPADLEDLLTRGKELFEKGQYAEAARQYEAAYKQKQIPAVALSIGLLKMKLKRPDQAQTWCGQAAKASIPPELKAKVEQCMKEARAQILPRPIKVPTATAATKDATRPRVEPPVAPRTAENGTGTTESNSPQTVASPPPAVSTLATKADLNAAVPFAAPLQPALQVPEVAQRTSAAPTAPATIAPPVALAPAALAQEAPPPGGAGSVREKTPIYKRWWFWTLIGVGVAGAAAGITAGVLLNQKPVDSFADIPESSRRIIAF